MSIRIFFESRNEYTEYAESRNGPCLYVINFHAHTHTHMLIFVMNKYIRRESARAREREREREREEHTEREGANAYVDRYIDR